MQCAGKCDDIYKAGKNPSQVTFLRGTRYSRGPITIRPPRRANINRSSGFDVSSQTWPSTCGVFLHLPFRVRRPDGSLAHTGLVRPIAPALLAAAVVIELLALPESQWMSYLVGHNARFCLTAIPLLAIGPLACLFGRATRGRTVKHRSGGCRRRLGGKRHPSDLLCGKLHR
jgi:hypothetical protein